MAGKKHPNPFEARGKINRAAGTLKSFQKSGKAIFTKTLLPKLKHFRKISTKTLPKLAAKGTGR